MRVLREKVIFLSIFIFAVLAFVLVLSCQAFGLSCGFVSDNYLVLGTASIHLGILSLALFLLWKGDIRSTLKSLGIPGDLKKNIIYTFLALVAMFIVSFIIGLASLYFGFNDQEKIAEKISDLPLAMLLAAAVLAPIGEELFFRASLVPRMGAVLSSLIFGAVHLTYGSVVEIIGAVFLGLVLAVTYQRSKSIIPSIASHIIYNSISIAVMLLFQGMA